MTRVAYEMLARSLRVSEKHVTVGPPSEATVTVSKEALATVLGTLKKVREVTR